MVYLDNNATTRLDARVLEAMAVALDGPAFGNPSSTHSVGVAARRVLEDARDRLSTALPGRRRRVVFTSGATEANALALLGRTPKGKRSHLVVSAIEHPSVLRCARELERRGCALTLVAPAHDGTVDVDEVLEAVTERTALVALMLVNNEVGTVQPVAALAKRLRGAHPACHLHVDAAQALGWVDVTCLADASSFSLSAHKLHGPKGVGALVFDESCPPRPLWHGGGQEGGVRSGTQNVAGALGLAVAVEFGMADWESTARRVAALRDHLVSGIASSVEGASLVGHPTKRSPANAMIAIEGLSGDAVVGALDQRGVIASTGSACHSGDPRASEVLRAMGHDLGSGAVRFGLSRQTTAAEIEQAIVACTGAVEALRRGS